MIIFGDKNSGNCYKIQLLTALLEIRYDWKDVNILAGDTQRVDFISMNPNGKIPVLLLDDGRVISESNAILFFLAKDSAFLPEDHYQLAKVLQWMFFEQYSHEPYIAVARFISLYLGLPDERKAEYESKKQGGYRALKVMETSLKSQPFLCGEQFTIADISLFAYTHVCHEGGFSLENYPGIRNWINRIEKLDKFIPMAKP